MDIDQRTKRLTRLEILIAVGIGVAHLFVGLGLMHIGSSPLFTTISVFVGVSAWVFFAHITRPLLGSLLGALYPLLTLFAELIYSNIAGFRLYSSIVEALFWYLVFAIGGLFIGYTISFIGQLYRTGKITQNQFRILLLLAVLHIAFGYTLASRLPEMLFIGLFVPITILVWTFFATVASPLLGAVLGAGFMALASLTDLVLRTLLGIHAYEGPVEFFAALLLVSIIGGLTGFTVSIIARFVGKYFWEERLTRREIATAIEIGVLCVLFIVSLHLNHNIFGFRIYTFYSIIAFVILFVCIILYLFELNKLFWGTLLFGIYLFLLLLFFQLDYFIGPFFDSKDLCIYFVPLSSFFIFLLGCLVGFIISGSGRLIRDYGLRGVGIVSMLLLVVISTVTYISYEQKKNVYFIPGTTRHDAANEFMNGSVLDENQPKLLIQSYHSEYPTDLSFSDDGRLLVSTGIDETTRIWDVESGRLVRQFNFSVPHIVSNDGEYICGGLVTARVYRLKDGKEMVNTGSLNGLNCYSYNSNEKTIAYVKEDAKNTILIYDIESGKLIYRLKAGDSNDGIESLRFSPDCKKISCCTEMGELFVWNAATGKLIKKITGYGIKEIFYSLEGSHLLAVCENNKYITLDTKDWKIDYHVSIPVEIDKEGIGDWKNRILCFSDNLASVLFEEKNSNLAIFSVWNLRDGKRIAILDLKLPLSKSGWGKAYFIEDDTKLLTIHPTFSSYAFIWDINTGGLLDKIEVVDENIGFIKPFRKEYIAVGAMDGTIKIWDIRKHKVVSAPVNKPIFGDFAKLSRGSYHYFVRDSISEDIYLWNFSKGKTTKLAANLGTVNYFNNISVDSFVKSIFTSGSGKAVLYYEGAFLIFFVSDRNGIYSALLKLDLKNNQLLYLYNKLIRDIVSNYATFYLHIVYGRPECERPKIKAPFFLVSRIITDRYFAEKKFIVRRHDPSYAMFPLEIWDNLNKNHLISLLNFTDGNWIVYTPDGYFDCSPDAAKYVTWKVKDKVYAFDQYWDEYYVPDLLYKVIHEEFIPGEKLDIPVPPSVEILDPTDRIEVKGNNITITAHVTDDVKVEEVVVAVNGRPINTTVRDAIEFTETTDKSVTFKATVPLNPGPNVIEVYAYDDRKTRSWEEKVYVTSTGASEGASNLYVLAIGVSKYKDPSYDLNYAADDAKAIVDILKSQKDLIYKQVHTYLLTDDKATTKGILDTVSDIRKTITMNDVLVIFLAGHGVKDKDYKFYFLTHDSDLSNLGKTALVWGDFQKLLRDTPARNVIMMLDSCHSGFFTDPKSPFINADKLIGNMELKTGVIVISSSTGSEVSIEDQKWGHGAFTYAVIEALKGKADFIKDKKVFVGEMNLYVPSRVKELTQDKQTPSIPRLENFTDFAITVIR